MAASQGVPILIATPGYPTQALQPTAFGETPSWMPPLPAATKVSLRVRLTNTTSHPIALFLQSKPVYYLDKGHPQSLPASTRPLRLKPNGETALTIFLTLPPVPHNALLRWNLQAVRGRQLLAKTERFYVLVPEGTEGTQAVFEGWDRTTQGNWLSHYGRQAFLIPLRDGAASFAEPPITIRRGTGFEKWHVSAVGDDAADSEFSAFLFTKQLDVDDPRVPLGDKGLTARAPIAFAAAKVLQQVSNKPNLYKFAELPLYFRVDAPDAHPHLLSLYFLDYSHLGWKYEVDLYDLYGHPLASKKLENFGDGIYLRFRFTGRLIVRVKALDPRDPITVCGLFVDPTSSDGLLWQTSSTAFHKNMGIRPLPSGGGGMPICIRQTSKK